MLIRWLYRYPPGPQLCWRWNLEWLSYFEHAIQFFSNTCLFDICQATPNHVLFKCKSLNKIHEQIRHVYLSAICDSTAWETPTKRRQQPIDKDALHSCLLPQEAEVYVYLFQVHIRLCNHGLSCICVPKSTNLLQIHIWARGYGQGEAFLIGANRNYGVISLYVSR